MSNRDCEECGETFPPEAHDHCPDCGHDWRGGDEYGAVKDEIIHPQGSLHQEEEQMYDVLIVEMKTGKVIEAIEENKPRLAAWGVQMSATPGNGKVAILVRSKQYNIGDLVK